MGVKTCPCCGLDIGRLDVDMDGIPTGQIPDLVMPSIEQSAGQHEVPSFQSNASNHQPVVDNDLSLFIPETLQFPNNNDQYTATFAILSLSSVIATPKQKAPSRVNFDRIREI
jgi:hypothetical protein